jgi:hypothetical protein
MIWSSRAKGRTRQFVAIAAITFACRSEIPAQTQPSTTTGAAYSPSGATVDVGALIDPRRDTKYGSWVIKRGVLYSSVRGLSYIQLPTAAPAEYVLDISVKRSSAGTGYFGVALVVGDHQCYAEFDGPTSGIGLLDGKPAKANPSTVPDIRIPTTQYTKIQIVVLKNGVTTSADGKPIVQWQGDLGRLKLPPKWVGPDGDKIYLKSAAGFAVSEIRLTPVTSY